MCRSGNEPDETAAHVHPGLAHVDPLTGTTVGGPQPEAVRKEYPDLEDEPTEYFHHPEETIQKIRIGHTAEMTRHAGQARVP